MGRDANIQLQLLQPLEYDVLMSMIAEAYDKMRFLSQEPRLFCNQLSDRKISHKTD